IAAVAGVDVLFIGPHDLSGTVGQLGDLKHPEVAKLIGRAEEGIRQSGKPMGTVPHPGATWREMFQRGYHMINAGSDVGRLRDGALAGTIVGYALGQVRPGDVLVIDRCGDHRHAAFGGLVAYACKVAKIAGVIIDGVATDIGEVRKYGVPLWCRGLSAVTTKRIGLAGEFCVPVSCGGVDVKPGDVIIADECGIVVLPPAEAEAAAERAIGMQGAELASRKRLDNGEKLPDISGATKTLQEALAKQNS